jgi:hypothetical protein
MLDLDYRCADAYDCVRALTRICFVGLENLPVLAPEFEQYGIGGAPLQQALLAKAFVRRGYQVSMLPHVPGHNSRRCSLASAAASRCCARFAVMPAVC